MVVKWRKTAPAGPKRTFYCMWVQFRHPCFRTRRPHSTTIFTLLDLETPFAVECNSELACLAWLFPFIESTLTDSHCGIKDAKIISTTAALPTRLLTGSVQTFCGLIVVCDTSDNKWNTAWIFRWHTVNSWCDHCVHFQKPWSSSGI